MHSNCFIWFLSSAMVILCRFLISWLKLVILSSGITNFEACRVYFMQVVFPYFLQLNLFLGILWKFLVSWLYCLQLNICKLEELLVDSVLAVNQIVGGKIPADMRMIEMLSNQVRVDQAILTGIPGIHILYGEWDYWMSEKISHSPCVDMIRGLIGQYC